MNFLLLLFTSLFIPCQAPKITHRHTDSIKIDTSRYAILTFNKHRDAFLFDTKYKPAKLSAAEVEKIEKVIKIIVAEYNKKIIEQKKAQNPADSTLTGSTIEHPRQYYKQMIATINHKRQKEVWVNCFCTPREKKYWRKGVVVIIDGGSCFFNLKINLSTNTVMEFNVNGVV